MCSGPLYPFFSVLPSSPRFILFFAFHPLFRVLPFFLRFTPFSGSAVLFRFRHSVPFRFRVLPLPVVVDHFTNWCEALATPNQKASTVAVLLVCRIFSRFGPPAVLHSDQGRNFVSTLLHEVCNFMGITKMRTTSDHPQCDGQQSDKTA